MIYLDDILILSKTRNQAIINGNLVISLLQQLGFIINFDKSALDPAQSLEYLTKGFVPRYGRYLREFFLGNPFSPDASCPDRGFQNFHAQHLYSSGNDFKTEVALSLEARNNLQWWASTLKTANGNYFFPQIPDLEMFSRESLTEWGTCCDGVRTGGPWNAHDSTWHINELEFLAAFHNLKSFTQNSSNIAVRIFLYNSAAVFMSTKKEVLLNIQAFP